MQFSAGQDACIHLGLNCDDNAQCVEGVVGGWQCMCNDGYHGDGQQCQGKNIPLQIIFNSF